MPSLLSGDDDSEGYLESCVFLGGVQVLVNCSDAAIVVAVDVF